MRKYFFFFFASALIWQACQQKNYAEQIAALESSLAQSYTAERADSLLALYQEAVKAHPDKHAENLSYLSRAARIKYERQKDAVTAVRWIDDAMKNQAKGQPLTEPIHVLALIWHSYQYKSSPELQRNPDEIDLMRAYLEKNLPWIDSTLAQLESEMGGVVVKNKAKAEEFVLVSESYATLVQASNPDQYVDLTLRAAGLAKSIGDPNKAFQLYYNVGEKMQQHPKAPTALFMMAYVYENDLKDLDKAKAAYETFLERYPNDPDYADDAQNALKFLGMPAEDILKEIAKNPQ
ncbi:MAG: tetratricopeptide repeat protein [Lewinellaceae bacterium]|nr:tetratricopeptide repeat protein [Lewinellaceae bacterium]MCB9354994.1 tetratricopeptide repeat protein [Lewinellaceae bacterium]